LVLNFADVVRNVEHDEDVPIVVRRVFLIVSSISVREVRRIRDDGDVFLFVVGVQPFEEKLPKLLLVLEIIDRAKMDFSKFVARNDMRIWMLCLILPCPGGFAAPWNRG
jgi:hypothetical protein